MRILKKGDKISISSQIYVRIGARWSKLKKLRLPRPERPHRPLIPRPLTHTVAVRSQPRRDVLAQRALPDAERRGDGKVGEAQAVADEIVRPPQDPFDIGDELDGAHVAEAVGPVDLLVGRGGKFGAIISATFKHKIQSQVQRD